MQRLRITENLGSRDPGKNGASLISSNAFRFDVINEPCEPEPDSRKKFAK